MNFEEFKTKVLEQAKLKGACSSQYKRAAESKTIEELLDVIKDNLLFAKENDIITLEMSKDYEKPKLFNIGKDNTGFFNSGDRNSGDRNSGDRNSGDRNSGDLNSGYRNSGVFCTKKRNDTVPFFNKESSMTWDVWYNHTAYNASFDLEVTKWISWDEMSDEEKKDHPKAFVCEGYVKVFDYHTAWSNLWSTLTDSQKVSFKTLPNFDPDVFKEVTGIDLK